MRRMRVALGAAVLVMTLSACSSAVAGSAGTESGVMPAASPSAAAPSASFLVPTDLTIPVPTSAGSSAIPTGPATTAATATTAPAPSTPGTGATANTRSTPTPATTPVRTTRPPTTAATTTPSTPPPANDDVTPCGPIDIRVVATITACLSGSVADFWSGQLNQAVSEKVVLSPTVAQVPTACQAGLTAAPAFTCDVDGALYITSDFVALIAKYFHGSDVVYAYASILAHEIGHVVQRAVDQPGYGTAAQSVMIEQQADCLAGVWAAAEVGQGQLDGPAFVDVSRRLIRLVSSNAEIDTHGTPAARTAAVTKGLQGGRPQSCGLATFS